MEYGDLLQDDTYWTGKDLKKSGFVRMDFIKSCARGLCFRVKSAKMLGQNRDETERVSTNVGTRS